MRVVYLDCIRIIATFGVIALHVFASGYYSVVGSYNWFISVIGDSLVRWSVPLFVMLSGALFLQSSKEISYTILLKKYIPRLLLAYVFWSLSYSAMRTILVFCRNESLKLDLLLPYFHLWYLPMLIGVYLLIPIIRKISVDKKIIHYALILWIIYCIGCFCNFEQIPQIGILFKSNSIIGYAGYFLLGYYVSKCEITKKQTICIFIIGVLGAIFCVGGNLIMSYQSGVSEGKFLSNLGPAVIAMSLGLFTLIKQATPKIEHRLIYFIEYIRKELFGIYLTHVIWLLVLMKFQDICNRLITLPIIIILVFILSLYTTKMIRRIPLLRKTIE